MPSLPFKAIHGENLTSSYTVWIGSSPCAHQVHKGDYRVLVSPPPYLPDPRDPENEDAPRRISFVRHDGVIFPTAMYYREMF